MLNLSWFWLFSSKGHSGTQSPLLLILHCSNRAANAALLKVVPMFPLTCFCRIYTLTQNRFRWSLKKQDVSMTAFLKDFKFSKYLEQILQHGSLSYFYFYLILPLSLLYFHHIYLSLFTWSGSLTVDQLWTSWSLSFIPSRVIRNFKIYIINNVIYININIDISVCHKRTDKYFGKSKN